MARSCENVMSFYKVLLKKTAGRWSVSLSINRHHIPERKISFFLVEPGRIEGRIFLAVALSFIRATQQCAALDTVREKKIERNIKER